jgi:hypothetical protein
MDLVWCAFSCADEVGEMLWCSRWLLRRPRGLTAFSAGLFIFPASSSGGQGLRKGWGGNKDAEGVEILVSPV